MRHGMRFPEHVLLQVASRLLKNNPGRGACRTGPLAWLSAPGPQNPQVDEDVRWDPPPRITRPKEGNVRLRSNMGYLSGQNPLYGTARGDCALPLCGGAPLWKHVQ